MASFAQRNASNNEEKYLNNRSLRALQNSLSLISEVLNFHVLELWTKDLTEEHCRYIFATPNTSSKYPQIRTGYLPDREKNPNILLKMRELVTTETHCYWSTSITELNKMSHKEYPAKTEMAFLIFPPSQENLSQSNILLLGFSHETIPFTAAQLKFLRGIGYAISIAIFEFEDEDDNDPDLLEGEQIELDEKAFAPTHPLVSSTSVNINMNCLNPDDPASDPSLGVWGKNLSEVNMLLGPEGVAENEEDNYSEEDEYTDEIENSDEQNARMDGSDRDGFSTEKNRSEDGEGNYGHHVYLSSSNLQQLSNPVSPLSNFSSQNPVPAAPPSSVSKVPMLNLNLAAVANQDAPSTNTTSEDKSVPRLNLPTFPSSFVQPPSNTQEQHVNDVPKRSPLPMLQIPMLNIPTSNSQVSLPHVTLAPTPTHAGKTPRSARRTPRSARVPYSARSTGSQLSTARSVAPTWEPQSSFHFPVREIPPKHFIDDDLTLQSFSDVKHIGDGSNSNIFLAKLNHERVIIKMIKESQQLNPVAIHEFDLEHGILCRVNHPNILKIIGAGRQPRRFIVLEYLAGGTLNSILVKNQIQPGLTSILFRKPSFTYQELLGKARDMADAFDYLHRRCHFGACIIHRDLKPDNIGIAADGTFKLMDFGLVTCVKKRISATDTYEMTGFTGSLRYMAPEVALSLPYSEKSDVYSFGILLWQMARDRVPFKGLTKDEFMETVVMGGDRPKLDSSWPAGFSSLLTSCWNRDPLQRPSFEMILKEIDNLLTPFQPSQSSSKNHPVDESAKKRLKPKSEAPVSTWF